jgi:hypothetical protein
MVKWKPLFTDLEHEIEKYTIFTVMGKERMGQK